MTGSAHRSPWHESTGTAHLVALEVLLNGPIARSEIARRLHLSAASLTRLTKSLLQSELFVEDPVQIDPQSGRSTRPLNVVADSRLFVGIRLTAGEAQGVLTTLRAGVVDRHTLALSSTDPGCVVDGVVEVVEHLRRRGPVSAAGISIGGAVTHRRTVRRAPAFGWHEPVELAAAVARSCQLPVVVDDDVLALTRWQLWFGSGRTAERFALITVGPTTGLGLAVGNRVLESEDTGIGLIGHLPLDPAGPVCARGHRGCAEAMLATGSIGAAVSVALARPVGFAEALDLARSGDPAAARIIEDAVRALGRLIAIVAGCTMTDQVIIAGEGSALAGAFDPVLRSGLDEIRPPGASPVRIRVEPAASEPWSRGAATLAIERYVLGTP